MFFFPFQERFGNNGERQIWRGLADNYQATWLSPAGQTDRRDCLSVCLTTEATIQDLNHHHFPLTGFRSAILLDLDPAVQMEVGKPELTNIILSEVFDSVQCEITLN